MITRSLQNLTLENVKNATDLLEYVNKNEPGSIAWNGAENALRNLLWSFWQQDVSLKTSRMKYYSSGIFELAAIPIINADTGKHTNRVLESAWALIESGCDISSLDEKDNIETLAKGVELGFIELAVRELRFRPLRYDGKLLGKVFVVLTVITCRVKFIHRVISSGTPLACLELIREGGNIENETIRKCLNSAIRTLSNIARFNPDSIKNLSGVVDAVKAYLPLLTREENTDMIMLGFISARLLIRLYGKDDSSKVILENPVILEFYPKFMRKVMDVGASKKYGLYGAYWKLVGFTLDLSLISLSDTNKQLLIPIIPLVVEMMALHHNDDYDLLRFGVVFLYEVSLDKSCLVELKKDDERVKMIQDIILSDTEYDRETVSLLRDVVVKVVFFN
jgi:hypothetical protein